MPYTDIARVASRYFVYVISALFVLAGLTVIYLCLSIDQRQTTHSEADVLRAIAAREDKVGTALADYAFWGEAYHHTRNRIDLPWVFDQDNIGPSLFSTYALKGAFIVGPTGKTRYALVDGALSNTTTEAWITGDLSPLLSEARQRSAEDAIAYGYFSVSGVPATVYAAVIRPDATFEQFDALSYLIFVDVLTDARLNALEASFELTALHAALGDVVDGQRPHLRLQNSVGEALTLSWESTALGRSILSKLLPILLILGCGVAILVYGLHNRIINATNRIKAAQDVITLSEQRFKNISEASSDWIWETDAHQRLTYLSERFTQLTGIPCHEWVGQPLFTLLGYDADLLPPLAARDSIGRKPLMCELVDSSGKRRYCQLFAREVRLDGQPHGYQGTVCDITHDIEVKAHIEHISQHDALTGLANRHRLNHYLNDQLKRCAQGEQPLFVLALDLDRFKPINDTFGHAAGDVVLKHIAHTITQCTRDTDLVTRLGGDEFIIVATGCRTYQHAEQLCTRLIEQINQPIHYEGNEVSVGTSIGVVATPHHGLIAKDLLRFADMALYEAKSNGRNQFRFYESTMNDRIMERRQLEMDMRQALHRHEFLLDFQPRFDMALNRIVGAEALVRWQHPRKGLLSPECFIPLAEETGLIFELSDWVMHEACLNALSWHEHRMVSVNLSPVEFQRKDLVDRVAVVLSATGLHPSRLELEITESVMLEDAASALKTMKRLKALGVRLSMDDFGTGYSSLSYLRHYPFDGIKIDRSFISGLDRSRSSEAIVDAIISMGHALALTVIAEGIETPDQLGKLSALSCDQAQGFYLGRPMSATAFSRTIKETDQPLPQD